MFCKNCGTEYKEAADLCLGCGRFIEKEAATAVINDEKEKKQQGNIGWWFLGFFFPIVGLILFCVWKKTKPGSARSSGWGALTGTIIFVVLLIILSVLAAAFSTLGFLLFWWVPFV